MQISRSSRPVAIWLIVGVFMLIVQIILGGITRLTGSGLSITEWNVVTGALPPLNEQQWLAEFHKYQLTPQYRLLNSNFTLSTFKFIFFWEWFHRLWARLMGFVFLIPFIIFLVQRRFRADMIKPLFILFLLGALQGAVGWIMVASGLTGDAIYVKPTRLALHFIFALGLLSYTFWFALKLLVKRKDLVYNKGLKSYTLFIIAVLVLQLIYGAFMAGYKAAPAAPTWPDVNGAFIPASIFNTHDGWVSIIQNLITIQFIHRMLAYLLVLLVVIWWIKAFTIKSSSLFAGARIVPVILVLVQLTLGILTVLNSLKIIPGHWTVFQWMAQLHQIVAMLFLLSLVFVLFLMKKKQIFPIAPSFDTQSI